MVQTHPQIMTDERTTAYLLEELTEEEAEQFEEQCFAQPEWPSVELDSAEADLIEAYVRNELPPDRKQRFEENYLTTAAREERVLLARSFLRVACTADPRKVTWMEWVKDFFTVQLLTPRYATIAATLVLSLALLFWVSRPFTPQTFKDVNLAFVSQDQTRGSSTALTAKITLPLNADALRFSLTLPEPTPEGTTYSVRWENVKGPLGTLETIDSKDPKFLTVIIPAHALTPGQYTLKLFRKNQDRTEQIGNAFFDVE
jgi:hypothetical protein